MDTNFKKDTSQDTNARIKEEFQKQGDSFVNSGREFASRELDHLSDAIRDASHRLHEKNDYLAQYTDVIANKLDSASHYFKEGKTEDIFNSVNDFAHKHPGLTIGGMMAAGFAASRFLKIGSHD